MPQSSQNFNIQPSGFAPKQKTSGLYKDGEYEGTTMDAFYGNVQVKVIVQIGFWTASGDLVSCRICLGFCFMDSAGRMMGRGIGCDNF